jgi:hypothetical protein
MRTAPAVSESIVCPLGQPKKAIGFESQIESWLTDYIPTCLLAFPSSTVPALLSLLADDFRTVLAVKGSLRRNQRRPNAPLAGALDSSGRSEQRFQLGGKRRK